jgi:hypothetical protein
MIWLPMSTTCPTLGPALGVAGSFGSWVETLSSLLRVLAELPCGHARWYECSHVQAGSNWSRRRRARCVGSARRGQDGQPQTLWLVGHCSGGQDKPRRSGPAGRRRGRVTSAKSRMAASFAAKVQSSTPSRRRWLGAPTVVPAARRARCIWQSRPGHSPARVTNDPPPMITDSPGRRRSSFVWGRTYRGGPVIVSATKPYLLTATCISTAPEGYCFQVVDLTYVRESTDACR